MVEATDIASAQTRLRGRVVRTPLRRSDWLSRVCGADVWLKLECVQLTGSFKIRGALNAAILHAERHAALPSAIVTASAGNHGRALALAAEHIGIPLTVFVPEQAPRAKTSAIERHGATLRRERDYDAAEAAAREFAQRDGATYISPYNDADVIAGAGTVAIEIFEDLPDTRAVFVPVGGGGLAGGVGIVCRSQPGPVQMIGVETQASHAFHESLRAGRLVEIQPRTSIADALTGNIEAGSVTFPLMQQVCDGIALVGEEDIAGAIAGLAREEHLIAEGGGAAAVAALAYARFTPSEGPVVAIVSGSNIDVETLAALLR
jgi:threonine dehydratase